MADPLRATLLDLLLERAATITELATAVGRPKSTVAYHVKVLVDAGMLRVVRTRKVRAIEERFYGRTARLFFVGPVPLADLAPLPWTNLLADAAAESEEAHRADTMWANVRHARIARRAPGTSGAVWRRWWASSPSCHERATRSSGSPSASTRRAIRCSLTPD